MLTNIWAVLLCVVVAMVLGSIWYGPLFGKPWMRMMGVAMDPTKKNQVWKSYALMAIASLILTVVLGRMIAYAEAYTHVSGLATGFSTGVWAWFGFIATTTIGMVLWEGKPWKLWFIVSGYYLVFLPIAGIILSVWR